MAEVPHEPEPGDEPAPAHEMQGRPGADAALLRDRESKAIRLRRLGGTYHQIAQDMGFADASGARQLILRALDRVVAEGATQLRALENERMDTEVQVLMTIMLSTAATNMERIRAADALTRLGARRARLNGLDAPVQIAVGAGSLAELDDALAMLHDVVMGTVVSSEPADDGPAAAAEPRAVGEGGPSGSPGPGPSSDH